MVVVPFNRDDPEFLSSIPERPAVYVLVTAAAGTTTTELQLGKTARLRTRLQRLLGYRDAPDRRLTLREVTREVRYALVGSEFEGALQLYRTARELFPASYRKVLRLRGPAIVKLNLVNPFPRAYIVRSIGRPPSRYFGPFASRSAAERFLNEALNFFKMRRCVDDLNPDPEFPGCVYSEMKMCLAPCFKGCSDEEYVAEVARVGTFLASRGASLVRELEQIRESASAQLDFELAASTHARLEKLHGALKQLPGMVAEIDSLAGVVILPALESGTTGGTGGGHPEGSSVGGDVKLLWLLAGGLHGPATFSLRPPRAAAEHMPAEALMRGFIQEHFAQAKVLDRRTRSDHLALLARWFYRSRRNGELLTWRRGDDAPLQRIVRACGRVLRPEATPAAQD
jgi:hypothetical protein